MFSRIPAWGSSLFGQIVGDRQPHAEYLKSGAGERSRAALLAAVTTGKVPVGWTSCWPSRCSLPRAHSGYVLVDEAFPSRFTRLGRLPMRVTARRSRWLSWPSGRIPWDEMGQFGSTRHAVSRPVLSLLDC